MSLPPETTKLFLDFLAAVGSLLYVLGGYFLGKWQSDKSEFHLLSFLKPIASDVLEEGDRSFFEAITSSVPSIDRSKLGLLLVKMRTYYLGETDRHIKSLEKLAGHSKWIGITCVAVGTFLLVVRLII